MLLKVLITGACSVVSRAVARSIRASSRFASVQLFGTDSFDQLYAAYEGLYDRIWRVPALADPAYEQSLSEIIRQNGIDAVFVTPESEVLYWSSRSMIAPSSLPPAQFCGIAISKERLYGCLAQTGLMAPSITVRSQQIQDGLFTPPWGFPCWIRDVAEGAKCGKGSLLAQSSQALSAWSILNPDIHSYMVSSFLPGRNYACLMLYVGGQLVKTGCYERLRYLMADNVMSGISGNISLGKLIRDRRLTSVAMRAVEEILRTTGECMNGFVTVDMREDANGTPMVTEINLRPVACVYSFAVAGFNLIEAQLRIMLGETEHLGAQEREWPANNAILRDIDGVPIWVPDALIPELSQSCPT